MISHPYGLDPDWYSETLHPDYEPVSPDTAQDILRELREYRRNFPERCLIRSHSSRLFSTVDLRLPDLGTVSYLYLENVSLSLFLTGSGHQFRYDYERVYRYLFLDQISEEEDHAVHLIRTRIQQELRALPPRLPLSLQVRLDGEVLGHVVPAHVDELPEPR